MAVRTDATVIMGVPVSTLPIVQSGIDRTGTTEVSAQLNAFVAAQPPGVLDFAGGRYRLNNPLVFSDLNNCQPTNGTFISDVDQFSTTPPTIPTMVQFVRCTNLLGTFLTVRGPNPVDGVTSAESVGQKFEGQHGIQIIDGSNLTFRYCDASHVYGDGWNITWADFSAPPPNHILAEDCATHDVGRHGLGFINGTQVTFRRFDVYNHRHWAVDLECDNPDSVGHIWMQDVEFDSWTWGVHAPDRGCVLIQQSGSRGGNIWVHGFTVSGRGSDTFYNWTTAPVGQFLNAGGRAGFNNNTLLVENNDLRWNLPGVNANNYAMKVVYTDNVTLRNNQFTGTDASSKLGQFINTTAVTTSGNTISPGTATYAYDWIASQLPSIQTPTAISEMGGSPSASPTPRLSPNGPGLQYGSHFTRWRAALANVATQRLVVNYFGDGVSAKNIATALETSLVNTYGDRGAGYLSLGRTSTGVTWSGNTSTTVVATKGHYGPWGFRGPSVNAGSNIQVVTGQCTSIDVYYATGSPAWTYQVDGGTPVTRTVNISGGTWDVQHITGLPNTVHTLQLNGAAAGAVWVQYLYVVAKRGTGGVELNYLVAGTTEVNSRILTSATGTAPQPAETLEASLVNSPDLLILQFGWRDYEWFAGRKSSDATVVGTPDPTYTPDSLKANLKVFTDAQSAAGGCTLLFADPWHPIAWLSGPSPGEALLTEQEPFHKAMKDLAGDDPNVVFLDATQRYEFTHAWFGNPGQRWATGDLIYSNANQLNGVVPAGWLADYLFAALQS